MINFKPPQIQMTLSDYMEIVNRIQSGGSEKKKTKQLLPFYWGGGGGGDLNTTQDNEHLVITC